MRILITGITGFLGTSIAESLRASFPDATVVGVAPNLAHPVDLTDAAAAQTAVEQARPTHVVHAAGGHGQMEVRQQFDLHCLATENLLRALGRIGPAPVFINVGSAAQYGLRDDATPLSESAPDRPAGPYGVSKVAQELLVAAAERRGIVRATYLRVFNPIGPGQGPAMLVPTIVAQLRAAQTDLASVVLGNLDDERDYLDVRDVGAAIAACLADERARGERFNICSGISTSVRALAEALARAAGLRLSLSSKNPSPARPSYSCGDPAKLSARLGVRPKIALEATLDAIWSSASR
ncbi:MAG: NAD-dependent epimerase/dehydratase family protein [Myxococcota bacterium]